MEARQVGTAKDSTTAKLAPLGFGLQFFPDRPAALREARRVLRHGGRVALSVWTAIEQCPVQ